MTTVLIIGAGDIGERVADGLAAGGRERRLLLAGCLSPGDVVAATVVSARDCLVEAIRLDAFRQDEVAEAAHHHSPRPGRALPLAASRTTRNSDAGSMQKNEET